MTLGPPAGAISILPFPERSYSAPRVSPDGRHLAYLVGRRDNRDVWVYDIERETARRLTFGGSSAAPVWSPDGTSLVFPSDTGGGAYNLYSLAADGSGEPDQLTTVVVRQRFDECPIEDHELTGIGIPEKISGVRVRMHDTLSGRNKERPQQHRREHAVSDATALFH